MPFLSVVALTFDIQTHPSEGSNMHVFPVNLAQIRLAVPGISHRPTRTNFVNCVRFCFWRVSDTRQKQNLTQFTKTTPFGAGNYIKVTVFLGSEVYRTVKIYHLAAVSSTADYKILRKLII